MQFFCQTRTRENRAMAIYLSPPRFIVAPVQPQMGSRKLPSDSARRTKHALIMRQLLASNILCLIVSLEW